jgi:hypothetical protein
VIFSQLVYMVGKGEGKGKGLNFLAFDSVTFSQQVYMVGEGEGIMFFSLWFSDLQSAGVELMVNKGKGEGEIIRFLFFDSVTFIHQV